MDSIAHFTGQKVIVSDLLKGGIPQYDIVDGKEKEVGRIHVIRQGDTWLVSQEFLDQMKDVMHE